MNLLEGYADSGDEGDGGGDGGGDEPGVGDEEGWDDAEGETDEEYEGSPEELAAMLHKLREAGALRDPGKDGTLDGLEVEAEDQVDWGESGDEDGGS